MKLHICMFLPGNTVLCYFLRIYPRSFVSVGSSEEWYCTLTSLHGISADKLWEQVSSTGLALPAPTGAGDIQDVLGESDIVTDVEKDAFPFAPTFSCTECHCLTFIKKVKVQADASPYATFKFESMQIHMQARHGPGDPVCCQGTAANLRGFLG